MSNSPSSVGAGTGSKRREVNVIAAVGGLAGALADGAATGIVAWDFVLRFALTALTVVAVSYAPRWTAIVFATVPTALVGFTIWLVPAVLALVLAIAAARSRARNRRASAIVCALAMQPLLRLPSFGFFGLPSLVVAVLVLLAALMGYRTARTSTRRMVRRSAGAVTALVALMVLGATVTGVAARTDADRGVLAARAGLQAARDGRTDDALAELTVAESALDSATRQLTSLLAQPVRLLPIASQHHRAISAAVDEGAKVAAVAAAAARDNDISTIVAVNGTVNLQALVDMAPGLADTVTSLEQAVSAIEAARSPWLVPPIERRLTEFADEITEVLPEARLAARSAEVVPQLLGRDGVRRYLLAFGTPAESREFGGLFGSYALIELDNGTVRAIDSGRISDFYETSQSAPPLDPAHYPAWFLDTDPLTFPQNLTSSPNGGLVADATRSVLYEAAGRPIDGLVYLDAYAIEALLKITGGVTVDGLATPLSAETARSVFFDEQYRFAVTRSEVFEILAPALDAALERLFTQELPGPEQLGAILGPVARQGRLQMMTFDDAENEYLQLIRLQRSFAWPKETADGLALIQTNGTSSKLDIYLTRAVTYDVQVDEAGVLTASVSAALTSTLPADAPEGTLRTDGPAGENRVFLSVYSPHRLTALRVDGIDADFAIAEEFGYFRYLAAVDLPANTSRTVVYELAGQVDPNQPYDLSVWHQPLVNDDQMEIRYTGPNGQVTTSDFTLVEDAVFSPQG